jgi:hypothetical protein
MNVYWYCLSTNAVPVADSGHFVDLQRCFIFRDLEFKQSTMSCGQQPDVVLGN